MSLLFFSFSFHPLSFAFHLLSCSFHFYFIFHFMHIPSMSFYLRARDGYFWCSILARGLDRFLLQNVATFLALATFRKHVESERVLEIVNIFWEPLQPGLCFQTISRGLGRFLLQHFWLWRPLEKCWIKKDPQNGQVYWEPFQPGLCLPANLKRFGQILFAPCLTLAALGKMLNKKRNHKMVKSIAAGSLLLNEISRDLGNFLLHVLGFGSPWKMLG